MLTIVITAYYINVHILYILHYCIIISLLYYNNNNYYITLLYIYNVYTVYSTLLYITVPSSTTLLIGTTLILLYKETIFLSNITREFDSHQIQ